MPKRTETERKLRKHRRKLERLAALNERTVRIRERSLRERIVAAFGYGRGAYDSARHRKGMPRYEAMRYAIAFARGTIRQKRILETREA